MVDVTKRAKAALRKLGKEKKDISFKIVLLGFG